MQTINIFSALLLGLMGAGHCLSMCGGIIASLSMSSTEDNKKKWRYIIIYQVGRISSYTIFGFIAGWLGLQFSHASPLPYLQVISGLLLIAMALYTSRLWMGLSKLEKAGQFIWKFIQPLTKHVLPVTSSNRALVLGALWGWLPCGLVYSSLGYAISLADSYKSATFMLMFGIGTLPATLFAGSASLSLKSFLANSKIRILSSLMFLALGGFTLYQVFFISSAMHHHH